MPQTGAETKIYTLTTEGTEKDDKIFSEKISNLSAAYVFSAANPFLSS
jgi:hypothetical protein